MWIENHSVVSDFRTCFLRMEDERTQCICGFTHHTRLMICCDECNVWLHAECYGLDQKRVKEIEKKNLDFFCNGVNSISELNPAGKVTNKLSIWIWQRIAERSKLVTLPAGVKDPRALNPFSPQFFFEKIDE